MIKPEAFSHIGKIIEAIEQTDLEISKIKMSKLTKECAVGIYGKFSKNYFYLPYIDYITSSPVVGLELTGLNAIEHWKKLIAKTTMEEAKMKYPNSLRARFGIDQSKNAVHGSDDLNESNIQLSLFFEDKLMKGVKTNEFKNSSCLIIKPHIIKNKQVGKIIDIIINHGFKISGMEMMVLDK